MNAGVKAPRWAVQPSFQTRASPQAGSDGTDRPATNYGRGAFAGSVRPGDYRPRFPWSNQPGRVRLHSLWDGGDSCRAAILGDNPTLRWRPVPLFPPQLGADTAPFFCAFE